MAKYSAFDKLFYEAKVTIIRHLIEYALKYPGDYEGMFDQGLDDLYENYCEPDSVDFLSFCGCGSEDYVLIEGDVILYFGKKISNPPCVKIEDGLTYRKLERHISGLVRKSEEDDFFEPEIDAELEGSNLYFWIC